MTEQISRNQQYKQSRSKFLASKDHPNTETKNVEDFLHGILKPFPDGDELYLNSVYSTMYVPDVDIRKAFNAWFNNGKTIKKRIVGNIEKRVKKKRNFIYEVIGATGEGKSWFAQNLGFLYLEIIKRPGLFHFDPEELGECLVFPVGGLNPVNIYFSYDFSTSARVLQDIMKPMELVIQDESEKMHGEGSVIEMDMLHNSIRTCTRKRRLNFIFCSPNRVQIPEVRAYFHVISTNFTNRTTLALVSVPDTQDDKIVRPIGLFIIRARQDPVFEGAYEPISDRVKTRIQTHGGLSAPRVDDVKDDAHEIVSRYNKLTDKEDRDYYISKPAYFKEFVDMQQDLGLAGKRLVYSTNRAYWLLTDTGTSAPDTVDGVAPDPTSPQPVAPPEHSLTPLADQVRPKDVVIPMPRFILEDQEIVSLMLTENKKAWGTWVEAWSAWKGGTGMSQDAICDDFKRRGLFGKLKGSQGVIAYWIKSVKGEIAERRGAAYEIHYEKFAKESGLYTEVRVIGGSGGKGHGKADIVRVRPDGIHEVVQLKCYNTSEARTGCTVPIDRFTPEIRAVRNFRKKGIRAILIGHVYFYELDRVREVFIDVDNLPVSVPFPI